MASVLELVTVDLPDDAAVREALHELLRNEVATVFTVFVEGILAVLELSDENRATARAALGEIAPRFLFRAIMRSQNEPRPRLVVQQQFADRIAPEDYALFGEAIDLVEHAADCAYDGFVRGIQEIIDELPERFIGDARSIANVLLLNEVKQRGS